VFGPLSLILLLVFWAGCLIASFGLLQWALGSHVSGPDEVAGLGTDLYMSGTNFFTLGLGDVTPHTTGARALTVLEGGIGFGFLALVIGYLPLISQAFSRREVSISMLEARAGSPPTAAQLLRRHCDAGEQDLHDFLRDWENWSAELMESHISFPQLCYFRSQHNNQSWVAALTMVLDVCCLVIARMKDGPVPRARLTLALARHAVIDLCTVLKLAPRSGVDRLGPAEEDRLESFLTKVGVRLRTEESSVTEFTALRATYEPYVQALSVHVMMPLPDWVSREREQDHWLIG
jgi:hypothetical protein